MPQLRIKVKGMKQNGGCEVASSIKVTLGFLNSSPEWVQCAIYTKCQDGNLKAILMTTHTQTRTQTGAAKIIKQKKNSTHAANTLVSKTTKREYHKHRENTTAATPS